MHLKQRFHRLAIVLAACVLVVAAAGCGDDEAAGAGSSPKPKTASPAADGSTMRACEHAKKAINEDGEASFRATQDALSAAELSDVPALRQIAAKYASNGTTMGNIMASAGAIRIETWCSDHKLA